jgi:phage FluMu protein Com
MVWTLKCATCGHEFGTVVEVRHLELPCPRRGRVTTFSTYGVAGRVQLAAVHVPKGQQRKSETTDHIMRTNRYVDAARCR